MQTDEPDAHPPGEMFSPSQLRLLKIAVVGMGVVLLAGFALVLGRIIYLVNQDPASPSTTARGVPLPANLQALVLPAGATVRQISLAGDRLAVYFAGQDGRAGMRLLDLRSGAWSPTIPVTVGAEEPAPLPAPDAKPPPAGTR